MCGFYDCFESLVPTSYNSSRYNLLVFLWILMLSFQIQKSFKYHVALFLHAKQSWSFFLPHINTEIFIFYIHYFIVLNLIHLNVMAPTFKKLTIQHIESFNRTYYYGEKNLNLCCLIWKPWVTCGYWTTEMWLLQAKNWMFHIISF